MRLPLTLWIGALLSAVFIALGAVSLVWTPFDVTVLDSYGPCPLLPGPPALPWPPCSARRCPGGSAAARNGSGVSRPPTPRCVSRSTGGRQGEGALRSFLR